MLKHVKNPANYDLSVASFFYVFYLWYENKIYVNK